MCGLMFKYPVFKKGWNITVRRGEKWADLLSEEIINDAEIEVPVYDSTSHISGGLVQVRYHHIENGISSHRLYIDVAWLIDGNMIGASTNLDGYAKYNSGYNNYVGYGNTTTSNLNVTNNIILSGNLTNPINNEFGFYNNGTCMFWGNLSLFDELCG